jgi:hypothetical protein
MAFSGNLIARSIDSAEQLTGFDLDPNNNLVQQGRELAYRPAFARTDQTPDPAPLAGTTAFAQSDNPTGTDSSNLACGNGQRVSPVSGSEANTVEHEKMDALAQQRRDYMLGEDRRIAMYDNSPATPGQLALMDRDIAILQQHFPNSPELVRLLQIRAQRSNDLAVPGTTVTA